MIQHLPALIIALPLLTAFLMPLIGRISPAFRKLFAFIMIFLVAIIGILLVHEVHSKGIILYTFGAPQPGETTPSSLKIPVRIIFEIDGLGAFMVIVSIILAFTAMIYALPYFKEERGLDRFYALLFLLLAGILGMELTGDMFNFFVFLEIASISASALIAFCIDRSETLEAGIKYLAISSIGALFFLLSVGLLYGEYDALNMAMLAKSISNTFIDKMALILILGALLMKAGIAPMHMWLPDAYAEASPPVTLCVIAATQASMYGLLRMIFSIFHPSIDIAFLPALIIALSLITIGIGATMTLIQNRLTRAIAFAGVAEMGYILLGVGTAMYAGIKGYGEVALEGAIFHVLNDAMDMGLLFLVAGSVYLATRELDMNNLGGLARRMRFTAITFLIALLASSGMPPMNGFASKLLIYESTYALNPILSIIAILASILMLAIFVRIFYSVFLGPELPNLRDARDPPVLMLIPMLILSILIIFLGIFPSYAIDKLVDPAVRSLIDAKGYVSAVIGGG